MGNKDYGLCVSIPLSVPYLSLSSCVPLSLVYLVPHMEQKVEGFFPRKNYFVANKKRVRRKHVR